MTHGIIFEPDPLCRQTLEAALASLYWSITTAETLAEVEGLLPGPWAALVAIESGDVAALEAIRNMREAAPGIVICALVDEHSPDFDRQLEAAGASTVFAKPVAETEIVQAVVAGFMARRS